MESRSSSSRRFGPWTTVLTTDATVAGSYGLSTRPPGVAKRIRSVHVAATPAINVDGDVVLTVAHDMVDRDVRIVAVNHDGQAIKSAKTSNFGWDGAWQTTAVFPGITTADVAHYAIQQRPYHLVEVRNIALQFDQETKPEIVVIQDPAVAK